MRKQEKEVVGGELGYQEFLKIISDSNHPEHNFMLEWEQAQGYKEFDLEEVNKALK